MLVRTCRPFFLSAICVPTGYLFYAGYCLDIDPCGIFLLYAGILGRNSLSARMNYRTKGSACFSSTTMWGLRRGQAHTFDLRSAHDIASSHNPASSHVMSVSSVQASYLASDFVVWSPYDPAGHATTRSSVANYIICVNYTEYEHSDARSAQYKITRSLL